MSKHILIISAVFPPEQVTSAYLNYDLAKALARDYKVTVLRPKPTRPIGASFQQDWSDPDFETIMLDSYTHPHSDFKGRIRESISFGKKCASYIREHHNEIDFIYNDGWQFFGLYLVAKAAHKHNIPYIVPIQDIYPEGPFVERNTPSLIKNIIMKLLLPIDRYYQKNAVAVRTITTEMRDYLSRTRGVNEDKYFVVNNWQNDEDFRELPQSLKDKDKFIISYVGSINVHANVELLIKAFAKANIQNSEFRIYGGGDRKEQCQKLVSELDIDNVTFNFVSRMEIPQIQSEVDVLALALPMGNGKLAMPSKLTTYMLSGKPVVASVDLDSAAARTIVNNHCGYAVAPDNVDLLAEAFCSISRLDLSSIIEMGNNSRRYATTHLTKEVNLNIVIKKIKSYLDNEF